ncbi:MAG: mechanosensitive ion channel [Flavobacteriaceae bacterium]
METLTTYKNLAIENFSTVGINILKALLVLLFGWLFIKLILMVLKKSLKLLKVDDLGQKINDIEIFEGKKLKINLTKIILKFVKWALLLMLIIVISEMLGMTIVSEEIGKLIGYLPQLLSAAAIFVIGLFIANFVKKSIHSFFKSFELSGGKIISQLVFFILLTIISITALNQAGVNTDIITNNVTMIFAAFLGAFALALGLGSRDVIADLLKTYYTRRTYEIGMKIKFKDIEGEIITIGDLSVTLKTANGTIVVPIKDIVENQVEIQG